MGKILTFHQNGTGSSYYWVPEKKPILSEDEWTKTRQVASKLLRQRGHQDAAAILDGYNLAIYAGDNDFHDSFTVLYREVNVADYVVYDEKSRCQAFREACSQIAWTLDELGRQVRFIGVELMDNEDVKPVAAPNPKITSVVVESALTDAAHMVSAKRPVSAVDRAHTALHGYLKQLCSDAQLTMASQAPTIVELLKTLLKNHPKFQAAAPHHEEADKIAKGFASILDAFNPIRNRGSLAHANESLLDEPEAMLVINASRTILHYMHEKLKT
jgi:hypothetical protein